MKPLVVVEVPAIGGPVDGKTFHARLRAEGVPGAVMGYIEPAHPALGIKASTHRYELRGSEISGWEYHHTGRVGGNTR